MDLEDITLGEKKSDKHHRISPICGILKNKQTRQAIKIKKQTHNTEIRLMIIKGKGAESKEISEEDQQYGDVWYNNQICDDAHCRVYNAAHLKLI